MLVPLMELVAVLLEPTHAARILEPGACAHGWRGGSVRLFGGDRGHGRAFWHKRDAAAAGNMHTGVRWERRGEGVRFVNLHVDASAVIGERGQLAPRSRGANEQLVRCCDRIIIRSARISGRVACRGHNQDLCAS